VFYQQEIQGIIGAEFSETFDGLVFSKQFLLSMFTGSQNHFTLTI